MHIARLGSNSVGLHFISYRARYFPRGWVNKIEMLGGGPKEFHLVFGKTIVASTKNGVITRENFDPAHLQDLDAKTRPTDVENSLPDDIRKTLFNLCPVQDVFIDAVEPTHRQNYYAEQSWVQVFRQKDGTAGTKDLDFDPLPCIRMFNLIDEDATSNIVETIPLPSLSGSLHLPKVNQI